MEIKAEGSKNIVAIIQARMGSTRLPGKVLMDISGKSMLWHVVNRLKRSEIINNIVVATSVKKEDDVIENHCRQHGIDFYRGSEEDVLDRYYQAAKTYKADVVVRITADCPLIDPNVVDKIICKHLDNMSNSDGSSNAIDRTFPRGLDTEVMKMSVLEQMWERAQEDYQREHVTPYLYEHPEKFEVLSVKDDRNLSNLRWTVDEERDLAFIREIYKRLYKQKDIFLLDDILKLLEIEPNLREINKDVRQKIINN